MDFLQKSRFVTNLALTSIALAIVMIYQDVSNLSMINSMSDRPELRIAEQMMPSLSASPGETYFDIFMQIVGFFAAIGLLLRLNWGRILYIAVLAILTTWSFISGILSYLSFSKYMDALGMEGSLTLLIIGNLLLMGIAGYIIWKLSTKKIREEFLIQ